jgi:hypothetical protein
LDSSTGEEKVLSGILVGLIGGRLSSPIGFGNESGQDGSLAVGTDSVEANSAELDVESSDAAELLSVCTSEFDCTFTDDTTTPSDFGWQAMRVLRISCCIMSLPVFLVYSTQYDSVEDIWFQKGGEKSSVRPFYDALIKQGVEKQAFIGYGRDEDQGCCVGTSDRYSHESIP